MSFLENKWGTQVRENMKMKKKILHLAESNNISLQVHHISGDLNVIVDKQSENNSGLRQSGVDTNRPVCNIKVLAVDALSLKWSCLSLYAFLLVKIITVLRKVREEPCRVMLIVAAWRNQVLFPDLVDLTVNILFSKFKNF